MRTPLTDIIKVGHRRSIILTTSKVFLVVMTCAACRKFKVLVCLNFHLVLKAYGMQLSYDFQEAHFGIIKYARPFLHVHQAKG